MICPLSHPFHSTSFKLSHFESFSQSSSIDLGPLGWSCADSHWKNHSLVDVGWKKIYGNVTGNHCCYRQVWKISHCAGNNRDSWAIQTAWPPWSLIPSGCPSLFQVPGIAVQINSPDAQQLAIPKFKWLHIRRFVFLRASWCKQPTQIPSSVPPPGIIELSCGKMLKISWDWCQQNSGYKHLQPLCLQPPSDCHKRTSTFWTTHRNSRWISRWISNNKDRNT